MEGCPGCHSVTVIPVMNCCHYLHASDLLHQTGLLEGQVCVLLSPLSSEHGTGPQWQQGHRHCNDPRNAVNRRGRGSLGLPPPESWLPQEGSAFDCGSLHLVSTY